MAVFRIASEYLEERENETDTLDNFHDMMKLRNVLTNDQLKTELVKQFDIKGINNHIRQLQIL